MSKEYIPKDELEQALRKEAASLLYYYKRYLSVSAVVDELIGIVQRFPAADVAPVVHGRWIEYPVVHYFKCSNCKYTVPYKKQLY